MTAGAAPLPVRDARESVSQGFAVLRSGEPTARVHGPSGAFWSEAPADVVRLAEANGMLHVIDLPAPAPGPCFDGWALKGRPS